MVIDIVLVVRCYTGLPALLGNIARLFKQCEDAVDVVMKLLSDTNVDLTESKPDGMKTQTYMYVYTV